MKRKQKRMDADAVESVHPSLRRITNKASSPMKTPCLILYLKIAELYAKWNGSHVQNRAMSEISLWSILNSKRLCKSMKI